MWRNLFPESSEFYIHNLKPQTSLHCLYRGGGGTKRELYIDCIYRLGSVVRLPYTGLVLDVSVAFK
jgi:hypothetical protein